MNISINPNVAAGDDDNFVTPSYAIVPQGSHLHQRVDQQFDFTQRDVILLDLERLATCPIMFEITDRMAIFNGNCYDEATFESYRRNENRKKCRSRSLGDSTNT